MGRTGSEGPVKTTMSSEDYKKVVIVGDGNCGKTSLLARFVRNKFPQDHVPTVFDTEVSSIRIDDKEVWLSLWDTAGQEAYERLRPLSYNDTDVVIIAYSIADRDTIANVVEKWHPEIVYYMPRTPILLVGTKLDLRPSPDEMALNERLKSKFVSVDDGTNLAGYIKADGFVECSALTNVGVHNVFRKAALLALQKEKKRKLVRAKRGSFFCSLL